MRLDRDHARRFLVARHMLAPPRALPADPASAMTVVARLGSLQFDPLAYTGARNHDLVLHARVRGYRVGWVEQFLYGAKDERRLFEAFNKALNILPIEDIAHHRVAWEKRLARYEGSLFVERAKTIEAVLARLRDEGPLTSASFEALRGPIDWHWAPTSEGRAVLEALFETGRVGIARRDGSRRFYDLIDRVYPASLLEARVTREQALERRLLSRHRGVGLLGTTASTEVFAGAGAAAERAASLASLVAAGVLVPVGVEGVRGPRFVLAEELPMVDATARPLRAAKGVAFIAPLDPLVWDRRLLSSLFEFDYVWEVYTPEAKRQYGYYVLPILFGDRLVGRIEPRFDAKARRLDVKGVWFEPGFDPASVAFLKAFSAAFHAFSAFVGATSHAFPRTRAGRVVARAI